MSLLDFFKKLFGGASDPAQQKQRYEEMNAAWEKERQEKMAGAEVRLRSWVVSLVKEKGSLPFSWESGNDEGFVTFPDNDDVNDARFNDLEEYIVDKLDIPSAGEFQ